MEGKKRRKVCNLDSRVLTMYLLSTHCLPTIYLLYIRSTNSLPTACLLSIHYVQVCKLRCHSCGRDGKAAGQEERMLNLFAAQVEHTYYYALCVLLYYFYTCCYTCCYAYC